MFDFFGSVLHSVFFLISFISGNNAFPKPLSAREERECVERMANGDIEARNTLIEHNLRLVAHIAKKYSGSVRDSEDLISLGTIGLIKGISSYDASKGTRLATYASRCIENEILMLMRSNRKTQGDVSLNDPIGTDKEGNQILLMDIIGTDEEDVIKEIDRKMNVKKLYRDINALLDEREKEIICLRYGLMGNDEKTQREIADLLGISRSYVSRIETKAISKLKEWICALIFTLWRAIPAVTGKNLKRGNRRLMFFRLYILFVFFVYLKYRFRGFKTFLQRRIFPLRSAK